MKGDREQYSGIVPEGESGKVDLWPYWYQEDCLEKLVDKRARGGERGLVVMATGLGKTVVAAFDVQRWLEENHGAKVLFVCHQTDILQQARGTFSRVLGNQYSYGYYHGRERADLDKTDILFATFQTLGGRFGLFEPEHFDYIVVDEGHHSRAETYKPVLDYFKPRFMLGITATPDRADLLDIRDIFGKEVYSFPLEKALALGLLSRVDYRLMTAETNFARLVQIKGMKVSELSVALLDRELFEEQPLEEVVRLIGEKKQEIVGPRVIIFAPGVEAANELGGMIDGAEPLHSRLSAEDQEVILDRFRRGETETVVVVDKFNEGIDIPEANMLIFLRSTSSKTIFYQQLGRGLRKVGGQDSVMVLDFVGNCARMQMVNELWGKVHTERKVLERESGITRVMDDPLSVDIGQLTFSEYAVNILELIGRVPDRYTEEVLLDQLRWLADRLGKTPTMEEVDNFESTASSSTFQRTFGSFNTALKLAGLEVTRRIYGDDDLLEILTNLSEKLGRKPTMADFEKDSSLPHPRVYSSRFGSFRKALELVGHEVKRANMPDEHLLGSLRRFASELGRTPTMQDLNEASKKGDAVYSSTTYITRFGSFNNALSVAGLKPIREHLSDEEICKRLLNLADELGRSPTQKELRQANRDRPGEFVSPNAVATRFGSYNKGLEKAGLAVFKIGKHDSDDILDSLRTLSEALNRIPTKRDIYIAAKKRMIVYLDIIETHFGSLENALVVAGLVEED